MTSHDREPETTTETGPATELATDQLAAYREVPTEEVPTPGFRRLPTESDDGWTDAAAAAAWGHGSEDGGELSDGTVPGAAAGATTTETTGSSRGSIASRLAPLVARVVAMAGIALHHFRTPGPDNAVWVMLPGELDDIAQPLSRIAARRVPARMVGSGDVVDGLEAALAFTAYGERSILEESMYRAQRGYMAPAPAPPAAEPSPSPDYATDEAPASTVDALRGL
jgi:hypothetical protein